MMYNPAMVTANEKSEAGNVYYGNGYNVEFKITSAWEDAFNVEVTIRNTSETEIENWAISFAMPYEIINIWNGEVTYSEEEIYIIKNATYNQDIQAKGSVSFGFTAEYEEEIMPPNSYMLVMKEQEVEADSYEIAMNITSDWGTAF